MNDHSLIIKSEEKSLWGVLQDFISLTKPRLAALVAVTVLMGIFLNHPDHPGMTALDATLTTLLILMLVGGAAALNCVVEKEVDKKMARTEQRAIPQERISLDSGYFFGWIMVLIPLILIYNYINSLTAFLGALSTLLYVYIYTPLKRISPTAVFVGAIPGALPPLMGSTAATESFHPMGLWLFAILWVWQIPHFMAISVRYWDDYKKGGIQLYPELYGLRFTQRLMLIMTIILTLLSFGPLFVLNSTWPPFCVLALLNLWFLYRAMRGIWVKGEKLIKWSRTYFFATIFYLPLLFFIYLLPAIF